MFSKYDVYVETGSKYCYAGTNVLRNKFNLLDGEKLKQIESDIAFAKQNYLLTHPISGHFTPHHLCKIHEFLFTDIYRFAGHYRTETIKKGQTTFLSEKEIPNKLKSLLIELRNDQCLSKLPKDEFTQKLAYYFAELNFIHPFREGNGRATREFVRELAQHDGYKLTWKNVETNTLLDAMITSVYDTTDLKHVLNLCTEKINN